MEKIYLVVFIVLSSFSGFGQDQPVKEITPVVVETNKKFFSDDHTTITISTQSDAVASHDNIGYILSRKSSLIIRNYGGYGSLTSVSFHGTGSNHTQVTWNGIPLNSPASGQADLSLLPAGFVQKIEVIDGASGSLFGSGTFGGSVNLNDEADWNNRLTARYSLYAGSYGHLANLFTIKAGKSKFQYHLSVLKAKSDNNFYYRDIYTAGTPKKQNLNNKYADAGIMQNIYLNVGKGNIIEAGMWYQKKILSIPAIMGTSSESNARQKDSLFRTYISFRKKTLKSALQIRSAYISDYLNYTNGRADEPESFIDSKIRTTRILNEADYRHYLTDHLIVGGGLSYSVINGKSQNYNDKISEHETAIYANLKYAFKDFIINAGLRKEFFEGLNPLPQFSGGMRYMPVKDLQFRISISTKFRKPSLNEKYWQPGGNPGLRPEKGIGAEISAEWDMIKNKTANVSFRLTSYYQTIDNWIQWIIRDSLTPVEYKKVHAGGIEAWIDYSLNLYSVRISGFVNYTYNRSVITSTYDQNPYYTGKQLIYVPVHSARTSMQIHYKNFIADFAGCYTGIRETSESGDAGLELPAFRIWDAGIGYQKSVGHLLLGMGVYCDNLLDKRFEVIRSYAVPGRMYRVLITLGYQKN